MKTLNHHKALTLSIPELQREIKFLTEVLKLKEMALPKTHTINITENIDSITSNIQSKEKLVKEVLEANVSTGKENILATAGMGQESQENAKESQLNYCSSTFYIPDQDNPVNCRLRSGHFDMHEYLQHGSTSDKDSLYKWHDKEKETVYPIESDNITLVENLRQILCLKPIPMILTHTEDKPEMAVCIGLKGHQDNCEQLSWYKIMSEVKVLLEGK